MYPYIRNVTTQSQVAMVEPGRLGVHGAPAASHVEEEQGQGRGSAMKIFYNQLRRWRRSSTRELLGWWGSCMKECLR